MQHDLERWRGFFFQTTKDNTDFKRNLFLVYIKKKKSLFVLYRLIEKLKDGFFGSIAVLSFYLITYLFIRFPQNRKRISMAQLKTEKKSYGDIFGGNGNKIGLIYPSLLISFSSIRPLVGRFLSKRIMHDFRILGVILKRYDLFIALRAIQYLAYYDRFNFQIDKKSTDMIIVFTDGNPHGRALMQLAHSKNIKMCFVSHGEPNEPVLPIYCDLIYLLGERSSFRYKKVKSRFKKVLYHGHKDAFKKIREIEFKTNLRIGIFLSKSTILDNVIKLTYLLNKAFRCEAILIRRHPNMDLSKREEKTLLKNSKVQISNGRSIDRDIEKSDFILAGDSTVHVDALLRGCPSFYYRDLEEDFFDRYGYVKEGLILDWNIDMSLDDINDFYQDLNKKNRINYYLNTEKDSQESIKEINEIIFE
ncbi:hypothetical protein ACFL0P_02250 [Candidatus Omnitrophota bacterium]